MERLLGLEIGESLVFAAKTITIPTKEGLREAAVKRSFPEINLVLAVSKEVDNWAVTFKKSGRKTSPLYDAGKGPLKPASTVFYNLESKEKAEEEATKWREEYPTIEFEVEKAKNYHSLTHPDTGYALFISDNVAALMRAAAEIQKAGIIFPHETDPKKMQGLLGEENVKKLGEIKRAFID
jgi:hypothetical protein